MAEHPNGDERGKLRRYLRLSTLGIELGLLVMIGLVGGQWLDKTFGTAPWLLLAGMLFGLAAGFRTIYRALKSLQAPPPDGGSRSGGPPR